ncbi:hypothetical protein QYE80_22500, partial [Pseudomonas tohonis]|nr:hypothetical protein [Pseudomonas tohonis]
FASHQREANSTAFQLAVNTSFSASFELIRKRLATPKPNLAPPFPPHRFDLDQITLPLLNLLIYKRFFLASAVEVVRIIGIRNGTSTLY